MSLNTVVSDVSSMADFAAQKNKAAAVQPPATPPQEPVVPQTPAEPVVQQEPEKPTTTNIPVQPEPEISWDFDEPKADQPSKFDFKQMGSALDLGEIKDESEFLGKIKASQARLKELETNALAGIPAEFKDALEVAKKGADWKSYLAEEIVDYSKLTDHVGLYEEDFIRAAKDNPIYFTEGKFDPNKVDEALDQIPNAVKDTLGRQLKQSLITRQHQRRQEIVNQVRQRQEQAESNLLNAAKGLDKVLPVDKYGIKFEAKHTQQLQEGIRNSSLTKKHFGGLTFEDLAAKGVDMNAVSRTIALAEWGEKMIKFKADNSKNTAKKEILDQVQNAQLNTPGSAPKPDSSQAQQNKSFEQKYAEAFANQKKSALG